MQAVLVESLSGFAGDARLYRVDPPVEFANWVDGEIVTVTSECVMVSAVTVEYSGPETYIFPADEQGEILSWAELDGSYRGGLDHAEALRRAGYEVQEESTVNVKVGGVS